LTAQERKGLWLGLLGVVIFSVSLPATRMAVMPGQGMDPFFAGLGRSMVAAALAAIVLLLTGQKRPSRGQIKGLLYTSLGVVFGFPLLTAWALVHAPSGHGAIVVGLLPLATAAMGAWRNHERPSLGFWVMGIVGSALVVTFAFVHGAGALDWADLALFGAVVLGAFGYAEGAKLSKDLGGWQTISWVLVVSVPFLLPFVWWGAGRTNFGAVSASAWVGFAYIALMSQYIGFFAWYQGLSLGGIARVSQVQLLQLFLTLFFSWLLLGEKVTWVMVAFALAVVATVWVGRRMPVRR
jgi:drug/metabolite transporter (DMT)-like permease